MVSSWREFWDRDTPIYVSARHKARHYAGLADEIAALVPHPGAVVLDHGCGEALFADRIAEACGRLLLCDASPRRRDALARRFAGSPRIAVLAPEDVAALPAASLDLVVANSLAQYLTDAELAACLRDWRRALKPGGRLVLADVIPPQLGAVADATALLAFARREGFLLARFWASSAPSCRITAACVGGSGSRATTRPRCWPGCTRPASPPNGCRGISGTTGADGLHGAGVRDRGQTALTAPGTSPTHPHPRGSGAGTPEAGARPSRSRVSATAAPPARWC